MKKELSEADLLEGLAGDDKTAVEIIYSRNYQMIQSMIINNSGTADDARDIFQEAMIVLYEKANSGSFELHCQIKTYLYSVARRLWLKRLQQMQRFSGEMAVVEETVQVEEEIEDHEQKNLEFAVMEKAMMGIGEPCKSLLEAFYIQKRSMSDIAGDFGYTNSDNAKNQKYKCLMRLKRLFFSQYNNTHV